jgi:hypothetical protein
MRPRTEMQRRLENGDVRGAVELMGWLAPGTSRPHTWNEAEATFHYARTAAESVQFKYRAYSHRWLVERAMPSGLPDWLRPRAERLCPRIVEGVGIAVAGPVYRRALASALRAAMENAVMECYAYGETEPAFVRARMAEARSKVLKGD